MLQQPEVLAMEIFSPPPFKCHKRSSSRRKEQIYYIEMQGEYKSLKSFSFFQLVKIFQTRCNCINYHGEAISSVPLSHCGANQLKFNSRPELFPPLHHDFQLAHAVHLPAKATFVHHLSLTREAALHLHLACASLILHHNPTDSTCDFCSPLFPVTAWSTPVVQRLRPNGSC